jgi:glycosyltransferase involved in cell wall biosynthesis
VNLHAFFLNQPEPSWYVQAMGYEHGPRGIRAARQVLSGRQPPPEGTRALVGRIADLSLGLVVHSREAARSLSALTGTPVAHVPLGVSLPGPAQLEPPEWLASLPPGTLVLASFGYLAPSKRLDVVLQVLARRRSSLPPFRYFLVGEPVPGYNVEALIARNGLDDIVKCTGYVDPPEFVRYLAHTDVGISLRTAPTGGEMSAALLQMMAYGQAVIVSDVDASAELPASTVLKLAQDEREAGQLEAALELLLAAPEMRRQLGEQGRRYVQEHHSFDRVAGQLVSFVQACIGSTRAVSSSPVIIS